MSYQQLSLLIEGPQVEALSLALTELGALSVTVEDAKDEPILEPALDAIIVWSHCKVKALFEPDVVLDPLITSLERIVDCPLDAVVETLDDTDWERVCLSSFKPMCFGKRLWICPSWDTVDSPDAVVIKLDPGLAFGTGTHPTTRLMLQWLDAHDMTGQTVIDYGCGSGILALAAARLGAARVIGVDYDPQAITATLRNAADNHTTLEAVLPNDCPDIQADLILANIIVNPLIELMPVFLKHLKPKGSLILSGILETQLDHLRAHLPASLTITEVVQDEEWVRVACAE